ncbi:phage head completion protein [Paenibacillus senegalimassiliensis]|uniref:phage head completion protein n=1 Tax=Paenibacillus senegalimassiliensis TaxID=1737426 RepID=UPI00165218B1|nr:head-tail adaptor protein [Paenibacillus senegalimassiliensis]
MWKPKAQQMNTQVRILKRSETSVNGAPKIRFDDAENPLELCNWKGKGGTESTQSGTLVVEDTAEVVMWYRADITQKDRLLLNDDPELAYDIIGPPENVEQRNMYLVLKVRRAVNT